MNHTVSLYFDALLDATLFSAWQRLSALGLESLTEAGNGTIRLHITLSINDLAIKKFPKSFSGHLNL